MQGDLNASSDRQLFDMDSTDANGRWPVYKGASFNIWDPDSGEYYGWANPQLVLPVLQAKRVRAARQVRSAFSQFSSAWVSDETTLPCLHPRIAFRDVARATDTRTVIATLVPPRVILVHMAPYLLVVGTESDQAYLCGILSSILFDWIARRSVETHLTFDLLNSMPVPRPDTNNPLRDRIEQLAGILSAVDDRYAEWAEAVGVPVGGIPSQSREPSLAELDAAVALLYGLTPDEVEVVYSTFHEAWDFKPRLAAVMEHYDRLKVLAQ